MAARAGLGVLCLVGLLLPSSASVKLSVAGIPPSGEAAAMALPERVYYTQFLLNRLHGPLGLYANSRLRITTWRWRVDTGEFEFDATSEGEKWLRAYFESLAGRAVDVQALTAGGIYTLRYYSPKASLESPLDLAARVQWCQAARARAQALFLAAPAPAGGEPRRAEVFPWEGAVEVTAEPALLARFQEARRLLDEQSSYGDPALVFGADNGMAAWYRTLATLNGLPEAPVLDAMALDVGPLDQPLAEVENRVLTAGAAARDALLSLSTASRWGVPGFYPANPFTPPPPPQWNRLSVARVAAFGRLLARKALLDGDAARTLETLLDQLVALSYVQVLAPVSERDSAARLMRATAGDAWSLYRKLRDDPRAPRPRPIVLGTLYRLAPRLDVSGLSPEGVDDALLARSAAGLLLLDAALGHCHEHYGFYPAHPAEIASRYFRALPSDPFTGLPYLYQRVLGGYRLAGPGPDRRYDDLPAPEPWSSRGWAGDLVLSTVPEGV